MPCCRKRLRRSRLLSRFAKIFSISRHYVALISKGHFVPYFRMNDIARPAEVHDHRNSTCRESLKNHTPAEVAQGRKHKHIGRSHTAEDFRMAEPAVKGNRLLDSKRPCEVLESFSSGPSPTTVKWAKSFRKRGAAARKARSQAFRGTRPPTKINSSLPPGSRLRESSETAERPMPCSGTKKSLSRYAGKLGIRLRRSGYDRCRVTIGRPGKR